MTDASELSVSGFADRMVRSLPLPVLATQLGGRVVAASDAARSMAGLATCEGMLYEQLPIRDSLKRHEMAAPELLARTAAADVWPVRAEDGSIVGAIQLLTDEEPPFDGAKLCAAMAHELKNPLTGIQGFAALLERDLQDNTRRRDLVRKIISGVHTVDATVSGMLGFCSSKPPDTVPVDLRSLITSALELAGCTKGVDIELRVAPGRTVSCDRVQMLQVLVNLIKNAAEAMPDGGTLVFSAAGDGAGAQLTITDTGCGMDPAALANIFRPFFSTKGRGSGMGLAVVEKIMRQHGGNILVESEPGKGARVVLTLPEN